MCEHLRNRSLPADGRSLAYNQSHERHNPLATNKKNKRGTIMKKLTTALVAGSLALSLGTALADGHEGEEEKPNVAAPVETFACKFNEGKGPADLDKAVDKFNAWADKNGVKDYSAWTLTPYYYSPNQEFDVLWLGASPKATTLGKVQDMWLATGSDANEAFAEVITCDGHGAFAALQMKKPPERDDPSQLVVTFSDCNTADGVSFDDLYTPIIEWGKYMGEHGSDAGIWMFFPAYGGGAEEFEFKWVRAHQNLESMGIGWDHFSESGWEKANELFQGRLMCDSSRAYIATSRRMGQSTDD